MPGKGDIKITGKLGEVMQESVRAAYSLLQSSALAFRSFRLLGRDFT
jgi:ATP-dependent Lon protease